MWHWQVKKQLENYYAHNSLMIKALAIASALHLLVLVVFITGNKTNKDLHITIGTSLPHSASVIVMPLVKRVVEHQTSKRVPVAKKPAITPKAVTKNTTVVKNISTTKSSGKALNNKPALAAKKIEPAKPIEKKQLVKKVAPKKIEPPIVEKKPEITPQALAELPSPDTTLPPSPVIDQELVVDKPVHVGYEQFEELQMQEYFEQEIARNWSPPPGFASSTECQVELCVSATGSIEKVTIKKSSGSIAYDASVRMAVKLLTMPKWAHNRSVHLYFKQS